MSTPAVPFEQLLALARSARERAHAPYSRFAVGAAVLAGTPEPVSPCGACRQVLAELCNEAMPVLLGNLRGDVQQTTIAALLPDAFTLPPAA